MPRKRSRTEKGISSRERTAETSFWKIAAILAILLCFALIVKMLMSPGPVQRPTVSQTPLRSSSSGLEETKVQLVVSEFECACGHCGKTLLTDCSCDRPHGALEEKGFIRMKLREGHSVEETIQLLERKYGRRIT